MEPKQEMDKTTHKTLQGVAGLAPKDSNLNKYNFNLS
jgi:hypothetical protein